MQERLHFSLDLDDLLELQVPRDKPLVLTAQLFDFTSIGIGLGTALAIQRSFTATVTLLAPERNMRTVDAFAPQTAPRASGVVTASYSARIRSFSFTGKASTRCPRGGSSLVGLRHGELPFSAPCTLNYEGVVVSPKAETKGPLSERGAT